MGGVKEQEMAVWPKPGEASARQASEHLTKYAL
jgi:hypothetical protein